MAEPHWYKDAVVYEVHVRAYADSNTDGIGDFAGLSAKLDYLQDLGVNALWLLPFYPSPLKDDGYDIADYTSVHPHYGTLRDFETFLKEAHRRGLKVITELVLNHTSEQHPWFQRARRAPPGSPQREFYVWSENADRYQDARIIFKDFENSNWTWDPLAKAYYWHRFYGHQPDLNYDNPEVRRAMIEVVDFWLGLGVDGLRLDAVPYLFEGEGTHCENLPSTHAFLKELRAHVDSKFGDRMLLAEANQWPEDAAAYFGGGKGDECHTAFHFPLMPRLFMAVQNEDRFPVTDILEQTPELPEAGQWVLFLRNHDELTLEMVTDEERDSMYRYFANDPQARINLGIRRRLAPLLGNDRRRIELMNGLLFSLPGTPVLYYGDEIGMGDNIFLGDRDGVRTPMHWSSDRNAGFSAANAQRLYLPIIIDPEYHFEAVNVDVQQNNPQSLLWWMKRLLGLRRRFAAVFGRGRLEMLHPENRRVLAFLRRTKERDLLVVANLSRFAQHAELDLSAFQGRVPVELFGMNDFPAVGEPPYLLTLGPHAFFWFELRRERASVAPPAPEKPRLEARERWEEVFSPAVSASVSEALLGYLIAAKTLGPKADEALEARILEAIPLSPSAAWVLLQVDYDMPESPVDVFSIPVAFVSGEAASDFERRQPAAVLARLSVGAESGLLADAAADPAFRSELLDAIAQGRRTPGVARELQGFPAGAPAAAPSPNGAGESSVEWRPSGPLLRYEDRFTVRLLRRVEAGTHPEVELGRFLADRRFQHSLAFAGHLELKARRGQVAVLATAYACCAEAATGWSHAIGALGRYFESVLALRPAGGELAPPTVPQESLLALSERELPAEARERVGPFLQDAELLGRRLAELHLTLAGAQEPDLAPEAFTGLYQRELYQGMRTLTRQASLLLARNLKRMPEEARVEAQRVLDLEGEVLKRFRAALATKLQAARIRCHGDFQLGVVLSTGKDFVIQGLEGDESKALGQRRIKRSPLRDVAGMLRSFHYAAASALYGREPGLVIRPQDRAALAPWAQYWKRWTSAAFLKGYRDAGGQAPFAPKRDEFELLLNLFLREQAVRQLVHELRYRPEWTPVALLGLAALLESI